MLRTLRKLSGFSIDNSVGYVRRYTKSEITNTLRTTGFEINQFFYFAHFLFGIISLAGVWGRSLVKPHNYEAVWVKKQKSREEVKGRRQSSEGATSMTRAIYRALSSFVSQVMPLRIR